MKNVFCLSGALESRTAMRKDFDIPYDKAILMSPIKYICVVPTKDFKANPLIKDVMPEEKRKGINPDTSLREYMPMKVDFEMDIIEDMNLFIDGELMSPECSRVRTDFFEVDYGKNTVLAEGYWLFLKPNTLEKGLHDVRTFSSCKTGKVQIPQEYHVTIT